MKRAYVAIAALALIACASAAEEIDKDGNILSEDPYDVIPTIPGDNSHYVEGKSRYIWFPDEDGTPMLVDLLEVDTDDMALSDSNDGSSNQYWLYTKQNPHEYQTLIFNDASSISRSNYHADRPTMVIAHGWRNNGHSPVNVAVASAFLSTQDCNVIVVDWSKVASGLNYPGAVAGVPSVGTYLGNFLGWLFNIAGGDWNSLHLVGHSLGAHVIGIAGRVAGGRPRRVTGMDPAGPLWTNNPNALDTRSGQYVEAIHTDGNLLGMWRRVGHGDFYPNGGTNPQPGCWISTCSHSRAYELFAATVHIDHLEGKQCQNLNEAEAKRCNGARFKMGNGLVAKSGRGIYGLSTGANFPF